MNTYTQVDVVEFPLDALLIDRDARQRRKITTGDLVDSIRRNGVLVPILITREGKLIAGERRSAAAREIGLTHIPARFFDTLSPEDQEIIELEENVKRLDLPWQDVCRSMGRLHERFLEKDPEWEISATARECSLKQPVTSMYLRVYRAMGEEAIVKATSIREAYNMLLRREQRESGAEIAAMFATPEEVEEMRREAVVGPGDAVVGPGDAVQGLATPFTGTGLAASPAMISPLPPLPGQRPETQCILHESFLFWSPKTRGEKFNFIHCDFPYGINVFQAKQASVDGAAYDDAEGVYFGLLENFCRNLDKFMSISSHLMFWFSEKHRDRTMQIFTELAPSIKFHPYPLIWVKSDNAGIAADARRSPRHVYETALLGSRGGRQIVRTVADAYSCPTDKQWHTSTKPEPMLRHFFSMLVDETSVVLDPTCGSASSLRAAESLGAKRILGMDTDEQTVGLARTALRQSRVKSRGAAALGV